MTEERESRSTIKSRENWREFRRERIHRDFSSVKGVNTGTDSTFLDP